MWLLDALYERRGADTLAIVEKNGHRSFCELWQRSEQIAHLITTFGVGKPDKAPIVLYGDKHPDMLTTMIAALKTGRAYVPVDVRFPVERLAYITHATEALAVFDFTGIHPSLDCPVIDGTALDLSTPVAEEIDPAMWLKPEEDAYILFTSGSTGTPKGVPITRANLENFSAAFSEIFRVNEIGQNVLNQASYSFDVSSETLYIFLAAGKTLVSVNHDMMENISGLIDWMRLHRVNIIGCSPSFFDICRHDPRFTAEYLPDIQLLVSGGESLLKSTAQYLSEHFPQARFLNTYGPTEATVEICACEVTEAMLDSDLPIPIGQVMPEADCAVWDDNDCPLPDGETGELIVFSKSVAAGYYHAPELTARSFILSDDGRNGYRTGDLVYQKDEMLYFVGRKDFQVKLNGYRIETNDIVANLDRCERVEASAVLPSRDEDGNIRHLVAFIVPTPEYRGESVLKNTMAIKKELSDYVPEYMIPRKLVFLENMPLNNSEKIDRNALKELL